MRLPMKQYVKVGAGWQERRIGLGGDKATLEFTLKPAFPLRLPLGLADIAEGDVVEVSPTGEALAALIARARRRRRWGGADCRLRPWREYGRRYPAGGPPA